MKKFIAILLSVSLMFLTACSTYTTGTEENEKPNSAIQGYYAPNQLFTGGEALEGTSLYRVNVRQDNDDTVVEMLFGEGQSEQAGEGTPLNGLPYYQVRMLPSPNRLMVYVEGVEFFEYLDPELPSAGAVMAVFPQLSVSTSDSRVYFQLKDEVSFKVEQEKGKLTIKLRAMKQTPKDTWHVVLNSFAYSMDIAVLQNINLTPTKCINMQGELSDRYLLISPPFKNQAEAETYLNEQRQKISTAFPEKIPHVIKISGNQMPVFDPNQEMQEAYSRPLLRTTDGQKKPLSVIMEGARVLTYSKDLKKVLFAHAKALQDSSTQTDVLKEEIYLLQNGKYTRLLPDTFTQITEAVFSEDGQKIAFVDADESVQSLYVYDFSTQKKINLGEEGFGAVTWHVAFDETGSMLYGMSGAGLLEDSNMHVQLMQIDFSKPIRKRIQALEDLPGSRYDLHYQNNKLYFAINSDDGGVWIEEYDLLSKQRKHFEEALDAQFSPNKKQVALLEASVDSEESATLKVMDLSTRGKTVILSNALLTSYVWSADGNALYYVVDAGRIGDEYPFDLYVYRSDTKQKKKIAELAHEEIFSSPVQNAVYQVVAVGQGGVYIPVTYLLKNE